MLPQPTIAFVLWLKEKVEPEPNDGFSFHLADLWPRLSSICKRWCWSKLKWESRMELPRASWPLVATPSAARHRRLIYQPRRSLRKLTGAALDGVSWHVGSSDTIFSGGNKRVGGNAVLTGSILDVMELFCIAANLVQNSHDGSCCYFQRKIISANLWLAVNTRTFQLFKDLNLMQGNWLKIEKS